ncbi:hypothetical protein N0V84_004467 [Fusarium piperis]|uniref:Uncharacterized protein n=1 Tax=Fusarium piperis TaxID=1435070 RepID=A0A9W8WFL0_9HYPO|nr:hypothetical protein N0V84_004467 [Fusarium piperis]
MSSNDKPIFTQVIPYILIRDVSTLRQAILAIYGDEWVGSENKGEDLVLTVTRPVPVDLKKKLQKDGVLHSDQPSVES